LKNRALEVSSASYTRADYYRRYSVFLLFLFIGFTRNLAFGQESVLEQKITLEKQRTSVYNVLNQITESTGYFFIYDSKLVDNEKQVNISSESKTLQTLLVEIIDDQSLDFKVIDRHILIFKKEVKLATTQPKKADSTYYVTIRGQIFDKQTRKNLPFVTVGLVEKNIGTISNYDGLFVLRLPSSLINSTVQIAHLGYKSQQIPIKLITDQKIDIYLETEFISIQEVIIRNIDPKDIVKRAYQSRLENYNNEPVYLTSFYREGVLKNGKYLNYSEAVLKVYKPAISRPFESDQAKLFKSRKIVNVDQKDTLILKLKGGLKSCIALDIAKNIPDFIDPEFIDSYNFSKVDIVSMNGRNAYAIAFEQLDNIQEPLFKGTLYIDMESYAIVSADFEINPKYVKDTDDLFILKRSRKFSAIPEKIGYTVTYNLWNGKYFVNHIRGDLVIKFRKRYHLFYNDFHAFLEMASCQIDTANVVRFSRDEVMKTNIVFSDAKYVYDESFWGDFNIIAPEEKLNEALTRISSKIEETHP
jgi:hypothetical protein